MTIEDKARLDVADPETDKDSKEVLERLLAIPDVEERIRLLVGFYSF